MSISGPMNGCGSANGSPTIMRSISFLIAVDQSARDAILDDQAPRGGAALAGRQIGRLDGDRSRRLNVLGVPHDQRVVAAELEREDLLRSFGELRVKRHSGAGRAGEQKPVDPGLTGERAALVGAADQQPDDTLRNVRFVEALDQQFAGRRASSPTA